MAIGLEQIGLLIKRAREDAGMTQAELADAIGLRNGAQSVSRYERAKTEVTTKRLRRIAEATDKPMSFFIQERGATVDPEQSPAQVRQMVREEVEAALEPLEQLLQRLLDQEPQESQEGDAEGR